MTQLCVNDCGRPVDGNENECCSYCRSNVHSVDCDLRTILPDCTWRVGHHDSATMYAERLLDSETIGVLIGSMLTPELAAQVVRDRRRAVAYERLHDLTQRAIDFLSAGRVSNVIDFRDELAKINAEVRG